MIPRFLSLGLVTACLSLGCSSSELGNGPSSTGASAGPSQTSQTPPSLPNAPYGTWGTAAPIPGTPVSYRRMAVIDGKLFVVGGRTLNLEAAGQPVLGVYAFDPVPGTWEEHSPLPQQLDQPNVAAANGKLFVLGAKGIKALWAYDPATREWSELGERPVPAGVGASAMAERGGLIYLAGGVIPSEDNPRGARVTDFATYDANTGAWASLPVLPEESAYFGAEFVGDALYTFGGSTEQRDVARPGKTWAFDLASGTWSEKALLPVAVSSFASAVLGKYAYIIGGIAGATGRINHETQVYDSELDAWSFTTPMPVPRFAFGAVVIDNKIYIPGGVMQTGEASFEAVNSVDLLLP